MLASLLSACGFSAIEVGLQRLSEVISLELKVIRIISLSVFVAAKTRVLPASGHAAFARSARFQNHSSAVSDLPIHSAVICSIARWRWCGTHLRSSSLLNASTQHHVSFLLPRSSQRRLNRRAPRCYARKTISLISVPVLRLYNGSPAIRALLNLLPRREEQRADVLNRLYRVNLRQMCQQNRVKPK